MPNAKQPNSPVTRADLDELRRVLLESMRDMEARLLRAQEVSRVLDEANDLGRRKNPHGYAETDVESFVDEVRADRFSSSQSVE